MSIPITPNPASRVRAAAAQYPEMSPAELSRSTGVPLRNVKGILGLEPKRRAKSVAK